MAAREGRDDFAASVRVEWIFIDGDTCVEFNRTEALTANDTFTVLASAFNPNQARGFVYVVARLGVTGMSAALSEDLHGTVARVRTATDLPVAVGFGISTADQARQVARAADGVVVGSALVDRLEREGPAAMAKLLSGLRVALDEGKA